jgi:hypothetical protein
MLAAVSLDRLLANFVNLFVCLTVNSRRYLKIRFCFLTLPEEFGKGYKLGFYLIKVSVFFQNFLCKDGSTSHI